MTTIELSKQIGINENLIIAAVIALFVLTFILIIKIYRQRLKAEKLRQKTIHEIDTMTGEQFEELLKAHFEKKGYRVNLTAKTNDYGADLILRKNKEITVVQAKRYKNKVGNKAVQEIVSAKPYYKADKAMVITNSFYTKNAINLARANEVVLWNRNKLKDEFYIK